MALKFMSNSMPIKAPHVNEKKLGGDFFQFPSEARWFVSLPANFLTKLHTSSFRFTCADFLQSPMFASFNSGGSIFHQLKVCPEFTRQPISGQTSLGT